MIGACTSWFWNSSVLKRLLPMFPCTLVGRHAASFLVVCDPDCGPRNSLAVFASSVRGRAAAVFTMVGALLPP